MGARLGWLMAAVAAGGAVVAALLWHRPSESPDRPGPLLPPIRPGEVTALSIGDGTRTVRLVRGPNGWRIAAPITDRANPRAVAAALGELARMEPSPRPVASGAEAWPRYEVGDGEVTTIVAEQDGARLPALHLGRSGFARIGDRPHVYEVPEVRRHVLARELSGWRDVAILDLEAADVTSIEVLVPGGDRARADRARDAGASWVLAAESEVARPFDPDVPAALVRRLAPLRGQRVADGAAARRALAEPRLRIRLGTARGRREILLGDRVDTMTAIGVAGRERVWLLSHRRAAALDRGPRQWRDKTLLDADPGDIVALDVRRGRERIRAVRRGRWILERPPDAGIDTRAADAYARALTPLSGDRVAERGARLPPDTATLGVRLRDGPEIRLAIGERDDGTVLVRSSRRRDLLLLDRDRAETLLADALDLPR